MCAIKIFVSKRFMSPVLRLNECTNQKKLETLGLIFVELVVHHAFLFISMIQFNSQYFRYREYENI